MADDHRPAAEFLDILHLMTGEQNGGLLRPVILPDKIPDAFLRLDVQTYGGLVQKNHPGMVQEGRDDFQFHPFPQRQTPHLYIHHMAHIQHFRKFSQHPPVTGVVNVIDALVHQQAFTGREIRPQLALLAHHYSDLPPELLLPLPGHIPQHPRRPQSGMQDTGQHLDGGSFSRPIGPQKPHDFAIVNMEADVLHHLPLRLFPEEKIPEGVL